MRASRTFVRSMGSKYISEEARLFKTSWWHPKIENVSPRRVASSTGLSVIGWNVMMSIFGESARTFGERFKEHLKVPLPYI